MQRKQDEIPGPGRFTAAQRLLLLAADMLSQVQGRKILDARRKRAANLVLVGLVLTLATFTADLFNLLRPIENFLYDQRAYYCQFFLPQPSPAVVHMDIDEGAIVSIGRWPWSRRYQARVVEELSRAGPAVVFLDIVYSEPSRTTNADGREVDDVASDEAFASALERAGNVLAPLSVSLKGDREVTDLHRRIQTVLQGRAVAPTTGPTTGPTTDRAVATGGVPSTGPTTARGEAERPAVLLSLREVAERLGELKDGEPTEAFNMAFALARERAIEGLILGVLQSDPEADENAVIRAILGNTNRETPVHDVTRIQYRLLTQQRAIRRFTTPLPPGLPELLRPTQILAPVSAVGRGAAYSGFVDYVERADGDAVVRFVPLGVNINGRFLPHVSLAMLCAYRGIDVSEVEFSEEKVVVPAGRRRVMGATAEAASPPTAGPSTEPTTGSTTGPVAADELVVIPVRTLRRPGRGDAPLVTDIPWFGGRAWETMYDVPAHRNRTQKISITAVENVFDTENKIAVNIEEWRRKFKACIEPFDPDYAKLAGTLRFDGDSSKDFPQWSRDALQQLKDSAERARAMPPYSPDAPDDTSRRTREQEFQLENIAPLEALLGIYEAQLEQLESQKIELRESLRAVVGGKIVLIGMTGTGTMDQYATSIHSVAPGVVAHGALVNGFLTGHLWTRAPGWVAHLVTVLLGVVTTLVVVFVSPWRATLGAVGFVGVWLAVNGVVLFDRFDLIVNAAGAVVAVSGVWAVVTLFRFLGDIRERERITARFSNYVDPDLVNYVVNNPEFAEFKGREQEMTVVFTDLEGFTTLSERMGPAVVSVLNDYTALMVPIIRANGGFFDKFLGDGIMFEFNAVKPDPSHAINAVNSVLTMQAAMGPFNEGLEARGLPTLRMRVGINTGVMTVGDAGGGGASNFTVLGDEVNLTARLEGANKPFGTLVMLTQATFDRLGGRFAVRPIAKVRVKGKDHAVMTYEPVGLTGQLTDEQQRLIDLTKGVVDSFTAGDFDACMAACDAMEQALGPGKLAARYRKECIHLKAEGAGDDFDGTVTLDEK